MGVRVLRVRKEGMFSEAWFWLAGIFVVAGVVTREIGFTALAACLLTIVLVSWAWNRCALVGLEYHRHFDRQRVFPGETVRMTIEVINRKVLPLSWVRFEDELPLALDPIELRLTPSATSERTGLLRSAFSMRWYQRVRRSYQLHCRQRGHYYLGPVKAESGDLFSLFTTQADWLVRDWIVVYPQIWPLEDLGLTTRAPFGEQRTRRSLVQDPVLIQGIRDYHPEDGFRHVHWKASARRGELQTRVYQPTTDMHLMVALNVATMPKIWMGVRPALLERAVVVAASIANYAAEHRWTFGLLSNGVPRSDQPIKIWPSRSPDQLLLVLEALAGVTAFATSSVEALLTAECPRIPLGATLVLVTAIINDDLLATLIQLHEAGRRIVLVSLADHDPLGEETPTLAAALDGIVVHHLPADARAFRSRVLTELTIAGTLAGIPVPEPVGRVS
jgi:uncharacterized protein (DUF58 family)